MHDFSYSILASIIAFYAYDNVDNPEITNHFLFSHSPSMHNNAVINKQNWISLPLIFISFL